LLDALRFSATTSAVGQAHAANSLLIGKTVPTNTSFQVPRYPAHPLFGRKSPLDGSNLGRIAILQPPTPKIDALLLRSREPASSRS
jgi:hypothetical protein